MNNFRKILTIVNRYGIGMGIFVASIFTCMIVFAMTGSILLRNIFLAVSFLGLGTALSSAVLDSVLD